MEKNNRMYKLLPFILLVFLFSSCTAPSKTVQTTVQTPENTDITAVEEDRRMGNTNSNILNGGHSVLHDGWIYFMNFTDNNFLYRIKTDGTGESRVVDDTAYGLNTDNNWLYYCNGNENGKVYKIMPDGTERTLIFEARITNMLVYDGFIYFHDYTATTDKSDIGKIFKIRTDGAEKQKVSDQRGGFFNIADDWIYYFNEDEQKIFKVKTDGSLVAKVSDVSVSNFIVHGSDIYYQPRPYDSGLYRMKTDGTSEMRLLDEKIGSYNISGDWIYYTNILGDAPKSDDDKSDPVVDIELKKIKLDGSQAAVIEKIVPMSISVTGDWLMYVAMDPINFTIKQTLLKTDGTDRKDYELKMTPPDQNIQKYPIQEPVRAGDLTVAVNSVYSTNVFELNIPGEFSQVSDFVINGAFILVNMTVTNESDKDIDLEHMTGITIGNNTYLPQYADITDRPEKDNIRFHLSLDEYKSNFILKPGEKRELQAMYSPNEREFPVYLSVFDEQGRDALAKIEISPNEERYVETTDSSLKIMKERFPGYGIELSGRRVTDNEGKMYYTFEVKKAGSADVEIYLVKRDTGEIFLGEYDVNNPEMLIPGKPFD